MGQRKMRLIEKITGVLTITILITECLAIKSKIDSYEVKAKEVNITYNKEVESGEDIFNHPDSSILCTDQEKELLARVIMSEGSTLPYKGKVAIMATIMNRIRSDKFPDTVTGVIYQNNQYSTVNNGSPTDDCYEAIYDYNPEEWPEDLFYFRTDYPHSFGYEYCHIGNTYFSTEKNFD